MSTAQTRGGRHAVLSILCLVFCQALLTLSTPAQAGDQPILIEYRDKPPYSYTKDGRPAGVLIGKALAIFKRAGLPVTFAEVPLKRIVKDLQEDATPVCSPGWYKLPERELFARFSLSIHQDRPQAVLAAPKARQAVRMHRSLKSLMADERLKLGVLDGISYGPELDQLIASAPQPPVRATATSLQLGRMVAAGRVDYMFMDQADLDHLTRESQGKPGILRVHFPDEPPGLFRYLMCSKSIDSEQMARINAAIKALGYDSSR